MAGLSTMGEQLAGKTKAQVEALLGRPVKVGRWTNAQPPPGASAAEVEVFRAQSLDEIWVYLNGRVHFSAAGKALKTDDKVAHHLPPQNLA